MVAKKIFLFCVLILILSSFIYASFDFENDAIVKSYGPEEEISGWINLSLDEEPSDSLFVSSFEEEISLWELLNKDSNENFDFECSPEDCDSNFEATSGEESKTLSLGEDEYALVGFEFEGDFDEILDFTFDLVSDNEESNESQLKLDLLSDGEIEWVAYEGSGNFGSEKFGCFVDRDSLTTKISETQYCEKINLEQSSGAGIGAYVEGTGDATFTMKIRNVETGDSETCEASTSGSGSQRVECFPDMEIEDGAYFVCIESDSGEEYYIRYEQSSPCGFSGSYGSDYEFDFNIFARTETYSSNIAFTFDEDELDNSGSYLNNLYSYIEIYIADKYDDDCSEGCFVPLKIISNVDQEIEISNVNIEYLAGVLRDTNLVYDLEETPALISSDFGKLYFDESGFMSPSEEGDYDYVIKLDGTEIYSEEISIGDVPSIKSINPTKTAVEYDTKFKVEATSQNGIESYTWVFGDGKKETTTTNEVYHTYSSEGNYVLEVSVEDELGGVSVKEFTIDVGPISKTVSLLLDEKRNNLLNIRDNILEFSEFEKEAVEDLLDLDYLNSSLDYLDSTYETAESDRDFEKILEELILLKVPQSIIKTASSEDIFFYETSDNINLDRLEEVGGGVVESGKEDDYYNAILEWYLENCESIFTYNKLSLIYDDENVEDLKLFYFTISSQEKGFVFLEDLENLFFYADGFENGDSYYYKELENYEESFAFSTTEDIDFSNVPLFVSPSLLSLVIKELDPVGKLDTLKNWVLFGIIIIAILIVAFVIWKVLEKWYKKNYEGSLFKNRNNLYNLVSYLNDSKKKGTADKEVVVKLKKAGWNSEQIRYAVRKYKGQRTGMPELSVEDFFEKKDNIKKEVSKDSKEEKK